MYLIIGRCYQVADNVKLLAHHPSIYRPTRHASTTNLDFPNSIRHRTPPMAANQRSTSATGAREKTYFEQQREGLIGEIAMVRITRNCPPPRPEVADPACGAGLGPHTRACRASSMSSPTLTN